MLFFRLSTCFAQSSSLTTINLKPSTSIKIQATGTGANFYQWFKNGEPINGATSRVYLVSSVGTYSVLSFSSGGCISEISDDVVVLTAQPLTSADVSIVKQSETRQVLDNEEFTYTLLVRNNGVETASNLQVKDVLPDNLVLVAIETPASGITSYNENKRTVLWNIASLANKQFLELVIRVKAIRAERVINIATVTSDEADPNLANNTSSDSKDIVGITIPNVFTPNGDGKNDVFFIGQLANYPENKLVVVNRWGSSVYEKDGYLNDWTANGLSDGTYFYVLRLKNHSGEWKEFKGYVTVTR
ncbi:gliding motility-associated C-terminal domain-containing protein [Pedobacter sp. MW01-1-1]|uniref:T9SS type B sorting domain-containing protein n=1 Tax=Pedobacter sp. MW01-1-1 TaxID=3383027 RepID=UPI003FEFDC3D